MKPSLFVAVMVALSLTASSFAATKKPKADKPFPESIAANIVADYSKHVYNTYVENLNASKDLAKALEAFTKNPTQETQDAAKKAWSAARAVYSETEAFRFYGGPIDDATTGPEGLMNAWPLDEAYIDYVKGEANSGIINNPKAFPKITKEFLLSMNEKDGEKNISTGYHAIEFLLWGQDFDLKSAGKRSFEDYIKAKSPNAERRAQYLNLLAEILIEHSQQLVDGWDMNKKGNYVEKFLKEPAKESIQKIFLGLGTLSMDEMSGERMTVPLEKKDQENEQSCFSDTTNEDAVKNQEGIMAIYSGNYRGFTGTGLKALAAEIDKKGEAKLQAQLDKSLSLLKSFKVPFDNVIMEKKGGANRKIADQAIASLQKQAQLMAGIIRHVGLDINIEP